MMDNKSGGDPEYFEADPSGMNVGIGIRNLKKVSHHSHTVINFFHPKDFPHPTLKRQNFQEVYDKGTFMRVPH